MSKYKNIEGAVPVDGDITPITRRKIDQIDASKWPEMSIFELTEQRTMLQNRIYAASSGGNQSIISQLYAGLNQLDALIHLRGQAAGDETRLI